MSDQSGYWSNQHLTPTSLQSYFPMSCVTFMGWMSRTFRDEGTGIKSVPLYWINLLAFVYEFSPGK